MRNIFEQSPVSYEYNDNEYEADREQSPELQAALGGIAVKGEVFDLTYLEGILDSKLDVEG